MNQLVVPPLSLFVLAAVGMLAARRWKRSGWGLTLGAAALLVLFSIPAVAAALLRSLECAPVLGPVGPAERADAIVVLGGDIESRAPEYGGSTLGPLSLARVRYAARLHRETGEPILTTGGVLKWGTPSVGAMMSEVLREDFGVPVAWVEGSSRDTWENAALAAPLLEGAEVRRIHLVTHSWHMRRARACFAAFGFEVIPAPTAFRAPPRADVHDFLPSAKALRESSLALHEWIGVAWYRLRYG